MSKTPLDDLAERLNQILAQRPGESLSMKDLRMRLKVPADDRKSLRQVLAQAVNSGAVTQLPGRRYVAKRAVAKVEGVVVFGPRGLAFLTGVTGQGLQEDPLVPPPFLGGILPRDRVRARLDRGARHGRVRAVDLEPLDPHPVVLGTLRQGGNRFAFELEGLLVPMRVSHVEDGIELEDGMVVEARVEVRPGGPHTGQVRVLSTLGKGGTLTVEVERLVRASGVPTEFSPAAVAVAMQANENIEADARLEPFRRDIQDVPLVTIDGEDAKDFDDAVHVKAEGRDLVLTVAIADVSHYVREGSALDVDAVDRGTSVYFPGRVIPMLPEHLSNGLCSLRPHVPRLCMVARMVFGPQDSLPGRVELFSGLMRSRARLTYRRVQEARDAGLKEMPEAPGFDMDAAWLLYERLRKARTDRGAIDLDIPEAKVTLDKNGEPASLSPYPRWDSHRLIEAFMIAANEAAARFFVEQNLPSVYRVHEPPDEEKLARFKTVANLFAREMHLPDNPPPLALARFMDGIRAHSASSVLQPMLLRSMMQARYDTENLGHYGLASDAYLHFTSPIRRYPDLMAHRELRRALTKGKAATRGATLDSEAGKDRKEKLQAMAEQSSMRERRATDLERKLDALFMTRWCQQHVGQQFDGVLAGMSELGLYIQLPALGAEGFVPAEGLRALGRDPWELHSTGAFLFQERSGRRITLGTRVKVQMVVADLTRRQVQLELLTVEGAPHELGEEQTDSRMVHKTAGVRPAQGGRQPPARQPAPAQQRRSAAPAAAGHKRGGQQPKGGGGSRRGGAPAQQQASSRNNQGGRAAPGRPTRVEPPRPEARVEQARVEQARVEQPRVQQPRADQARAEPPRAAQARGGHADPAQAQGQRRDGPDAGKVRPPQDVRMAKAADRARMVEERAAARRAARKEQK